VGDNALARGDAPPNSYEPPTGFSVNIASKGVAEAERIFLSLAENGTIRMPLQQTFWAARFGRLVDRFGTPWMINCEQVASRTA